MIACTVIVPKPATISRAKLSIRASSVTISSFLSDLSVFFSYGLGFSPLCWLPRTRSRSWLDCSLISRKAAVSSMFPKQLKRVNSPHGIVQEENIGHIISCQLFGHTQDVVGISVWNSQDNTIRTALHNCQATLYFMSMTGTTNLFTSHLCINIVDRSSINDDLLLVFVLQ